MTAAYEGQKNTRLENKLTTTDKTAITFCFFVVRVEIYASYAAIYY